MVNAFVSLVLGGIHRVTQPQWTYKDTLTALIVVLIWGINFVPMKFALEAISPFELGAVRYFFAAVPLCFFVRFPKVRYRWLIATAGFQCIGQFSFLFIALQVGMTAALASVLFQTQIYFTALWGFLIYRHRPNQLLWLSMTTAAIGLCFFAVSALSDSSGDSVTGWGIGFMLAASAMWGANNLIVRQVQFESPNYNALSYIVWSSAIAVFGYIVIVALWLPDSEKWLHFSTWTALSAKTWLSVLFLGWVATLVGYALWTHLLKGHHPNQVAPFSLGVPVVGLLAGLLWLREPIDSWQWLGTVFVGISLVIVVLGPRWLAKKHSLK